MSTNIWYQLRKLLRLVTISIIVFFALFRKKMEEEIGRLRTLHSVLHNAQAQHLPQNTIWKVESSCLQLEEDLIKMGTPKT